MNPKALLTFIDETRADMANRVERLSAISPRPINPSSTTKSASHTIANVLDATLAAQLAAAQEGLNLIGGERQAPAAPSGQDGPAAIDLSAADYKVLDK